MEPFTLVIFGATGNLASIKLLPTLYDLLASHALPVPFSVVGIGRRDLSLEGFKAFVSAALRAPNRHHTHDIDKVVEAKLLARLQYLSLDTEKGDFGSLSSLLASLPEGGNRLYYLATYPSLYEGIFHKLEASGLNDQKRGFVRVIIEKPLGHDLVSAKSLNHLLGKYYQEDQLFRLDHYLGKHTLQNILTFRFDNRIFEPLMTHEYLDHVEVTASEDFGIGSRGGYYDTAGALRDVGQNHLLQMLAISLMEEPTSRDNLGVTKSRVALLDSLVPDTTSLQVGQYEGYQTEGGVAPTSNTETYFSFRATSTLARYQGVPFYVRAGKYLTTTATEIALFFKHSPNVLIYRLQPNAGIVLRLSVTNPETKTLEEAYMQYCYQTSVKDLPDAYHNLLLDALRGEQTFFNDAPEIEAQWRFIDPLIKTKASLPLTPYTRGSWGPGKESVSWLAPSAVFCNI